MWFVNVYPFCLFQIVVRRVDDSVLMIDDEEDEGSAMLAAEMASGFNLDDTHMDDEDYLNMDTINVGFECEYLTPASRVSTDSINRIM